MLKELFRVDPPILELLTTPIHRQVAHLSQHMYPTTLVMCNFVNCMPYESVISDVDWVAAFAEKKELKCVFCHKSKLFTALLYEESKVL